MAKEFRSNLFSADKKDTIVNLETIQLTLNECVEEGMLDDGSQLYNELIALIDEAKLVQNYPELEEVITKAKTIETDVDLFLSMKHRETLSITWPKQPK